MVVTADNKGMFSSITDDNWINMVLAEWQNPAYVSNSLQSGFILRAQRDLLYSQRAEVNTRCSSEGDMALSVTKGPLTIADFGPQGVVKTLAPDIFIVSSRTVDAPTLTILRNGVEQVFWNELVLVEPWGYNWKEAIYSIPHAVASSGGQYANLPVILADDTIYTIFTDFADLACYKTSHTWTFTVDLGPPGADSTDGTMPEVDSAALFPKAGDTVAVKGDLTCRIYDDESGIDYRTIEFEVNGTVIIPAGGITREHYNPATGELRYPLIKLPGEICHAVVRASNFKGIQTIVSWTFTLR
jgi:hypothetical protein